MIQEEYLDSCFGEKSIFPLPGWPVCSGTGGCNKTEQPARINRISGRNGPENALYWLKLLNGFYWATCGLIGKENGLPKNVAKQLMFLFDKDKRSFGWQLKYKSSFSRSFLLKLYSRDCSGGLEGLPSEDKRGALRQNHCGISFIRKGKGRKRETVENTE
ncbi:MAG: hypothetical protein ABSA46_13695 [Thermodesulfovibrionales bacterium]